MRKGSPEDSLDNLAGKSAGQIRNSNLQSDNPYYVSIVDAATIMWERSMDSWVYVTQREDETTIWRAPDESALAIVDLDGTAKIVHL